MILGLYGASGLGTEYLQLAKVINAHTPRWDGFVFVDDDPKKEGTTLSNLPIMNFNAAIEKYGTEGIEFMISIGEPFIKDILFKKVIESGADVTNLIHPDVLIDDTFTHGKGLLIHRYSSTPPYAVFGNNVLIQGTTAMGHNLVLGDNVVVSSLSFIGGDTKIGRNTYVGPSSCIRNGLTIGENVIIGMGSVVTKDIPDNAVVYGNPAKIMRYNEKGRVFSK